MTTMSVSLPNELESRDNRDWLRVHDAWVRRGHRLSVERREVAQTIAEVAPTLLEHCSVVGYHLIIGYRSDDLVEQRTELVGELGVGEDVWRVGAHASHHAMADLGRIQPRGVTWK